MKRILITGCGGAAAINFSRSLREADKQRQAYFLIGVDCNKYTVHRSECDKNYLCPEANNKEYLRFILEIVRQERIEFIHAQPDIEVAIIGKHREQLEHAGCKVFLPSQETIEILQDKEKSYRVWKEAGILVPETNFLASEEDLERSFSSFGSDIWIRDITGAAGKGSLSRPTYELAKAWIDFKEGWGRMIASQHLTDQTATWQSVWNNGELVVGQGRKRLYWELSNRTQSGVTGVTGAGVTFNDTALADLAIECIRAVDRKPHGIFSVDFTYDSQGKPNPTEINIGRFFTTHHFLTKAGCNMPKVLVELAFGGYKGDYNIINPCQEGVCWVRGVDKEPVMVSKKEIEDLYQSYLAKLEDI